MPEQITLTDDKLNSFVKRLSGKMGTDSKVTISYFAYAQGEEDDPKNQIYSLSPLVYIQISANKMLPDFFTVDLVFPSSNDMTLNLLWARLQQHRRLEALNPEKLWIFYFNFIENASVLSDTDEPILTMHALNPLMFYLTREVPSQDAEDQIIDNEIQGGNIIRMLFHESLVSFSDSNDLNKTEIQAEVLNYIDADNYINATQTE